MSDSKSLILVVDDSRLSIEILKDILLKHYRLLIAENGLEALKLACGDPRPDLILMDVVMPGIDGFETCRRLKTMPECCDIPVIFLTSQTTGENIIQGFDAGAVDYIPKPFNIPELLVRVRNHLTLKFARDQNERLMEKIETINSKLTAGIRYARKIQSASLPDAALMKSLLPPHFVFLQPKEIVSGDFYWVGEVEDNVVVVVADSTGHGVPGAFMSMFGMAQINQIVAVQKICTPSVILDTLRKEVIKAFKQTEASEIKDGMDISVISLNRESRTIQFAGAFNPLYMVRGGVLEAIPADSMPISIGLRYKSYTNYVLEYQTGDCFYMASDGYASQFGGPNDKKIKTSGLKKLMVEYAPLPMDAQKKAFTSFFENWKGNGEQTDDVLLMGLRME
jgi:CheY-like chemotaxis protein/serine phosphatase RsbU (regulator of sigma subunit)